MKKRETSVSHHNGKDLLKAYEETDVDSGTFKSKQINDVDDDSDQDIKDLKVAEILEESQSYMEKNLNAACNNMSLLTLHAFQIGG